MYKVFGENNMKNFKIYKSVLAIFTSASILLLSGCSGDSNNKEKVKSQSCKHLTIYFEDEPITFKECDGYEINVDREGYSSEINYKIKKENKTIFGGITTNYNSYSVYHDLADDIIENEAIQKVK